MFDIPCPVCGEPWDNDELHERAEEIALDHENYGDVYDRVRGYFRINGCEFFGAEHNAHGNRQVAEATRTLMNIMPDDFDGVVAMLQDAGLA